MTWVLTQTGTTVTGSMVGNQGLVQNGINASGPVSGALSAPTPGATLTFEVAFAYPDGCSAIFTGTATTTTTTIQGTYEGADCFHSFTDGQLFLAKR
jgi:hypothetical protein